MPHSLAVAVLGFSDFERQALTAAFRASQNQALSLRLAANEDEAALFVFDTDRAGPRGGPPPPRRPRCSSPPPPAPARPRPWAPAGTAPARCASVPTRPTTPWPG